MFTWASWISFILQTMRWRQQIAEAAGEAEEFLAEHMQRPWGGMR